MLILEGTPRQSGVAMAVAVVVDVQRGLSGLPEKILRQGLKALKSNVPKDEWPEIIVICDMLAIGCAVNMPGLRVIGIVSQSDDHPSLPLAVPCITGVEGVLRSVTDEEIVIVDADSGVVYVGPDAQTIISYQSTSEEEPAQRICFESSDAVAQTLYGRTVKVGAVVSTLKEIEAAITGGADALVVKFSELLKNESESGKLAEEDARVELLQMASALSAGKPMLLLLKHPDDILAVYLQRMSHATLMIVDDYPPLTSEGVRSAVASGADRVDVAAGAVARTKELIRTLP